MAVIVGLELLKKDSMEVVVFSDSKYVVDSVEKKWVFGWEKKNFKGKKNVDLWKRYLAVQGKFNIEFEWVKGHAGHPENERCDVLAFNVADDFSNHLIDEVFEKERSEK